MRLGTPETAPDPDPGEPAGPRHEPDLTPMMEIREVRAKDRYSVTEERAEAQRKWRDAYFAAKRKGLIDDE